VTLGSNQATRELRMVEAEHTLEVDAESRSRKTNRWGIAGAGLLMQMAHSDRGAIISSMLTSPCIIHRSHTVQESTSPQSENTDASQDLYQII
jgi:hypothetical protein